MKKPSNLQNQSNYRVTVWLILPFKMLSSLASKRGKKSYNNSQGLSVYYVPGNTASIYSLI